MKFICTAITEHSSTEKYQTAKDAERYYKGENVTILNYQRFVRNQEGLKVPDVWSPNNKIVSNWYFYFTTQAVQYLLGNGVSFGNEQTAAKLGKDFDRKLNKLAIMAKNGGRAYGFFDRDHIEVFSYTEFIPLYDEENGSLSAGIRFWRLEDGKPLRATLYELDGLTEYIQRKNADMEMYKAKRPYKLTIKRSQIDGEQIVSGSNYPTFPIVPLRNVNEVSDLVSLRSVIDAYDLISSGLINNVSEGELVYWILKNCNAMNAEDDANFLEKLRSTRVAHADGDDGAGVEAHKIETPFQASAASLEHLENQLYKNAMALRVDDVRAGSVTATQIKAAYEPLNQKTDMFEFCVIDFVQGILAVAGIEDEPTFERSTIANQAEMINNVLASAEYLSREFITRKICTILGNPEAAEEMLEAQEKEEAERFTAEEPSEEENEVNSDEDND